MTTSVVSLQLIKQLEAASLRARPALASVACQGYLILQASGFSNRCNSVSVLEPDQYSFHSFEGVKAFVETEYARAKLPPLFRISPLYPPEVEPHLRRTGYERSGDDVVVMTFPLRGALSCTAPSRSRQSSSLVTRLSITAKPPARWIETFGSLQNYSQWKNETHAKVLQKIHQSTGYVAIKLAGASAKENENESIIAFGLGVYDLSTGLVGIVDVLVDTAYRGQGLGGDVVLALLQWGLSLRESSSVPIDAEDSETLGWLQVVSSNKTGRRLYERIGFTECYRYHYLGKVS